MAPIRRLISGLSLLLAAASSAIAAGAPPDGPVEWLRAASATARELRQAPATPWFDPIDALLWDTASAQVRAGDLDGATVTADSIAAADQRLAALAEIAGHGCEPLLDRLEAAQAHAGAAPVSYAVLLLRCAQAERADAYVDGLDEPLRSRARIALAEYSFRRGDAESSARRLAAVDPSGTVPGGGHVRAHLAQAAFEGGSAEEALRLVGEIIAGPTADADIEGLLDNLLDKAQFDDAEQVIELDGKSRSRKSRLVRVARTQLESGTVTEAWSIAEKLSCPDEARDCSSSARDRLLVDLVGWHADRGDRPRAGELTSEIQGLRRRAEALESVARSFLDSADRTQAEPIVEQLREIRDTAEDRTLQLVTSRILIDLSLQLGDTDSAMAQAKRTLQSSSDSAAAPGHARELATMAALLEAEPTIDVEWPQKLWTDAQDTLSRLLVVSRRTSGRIGELRDALEALGPGDPARIKIDPCETILAKAQVPASIAPSIVATYAAVAAARGSKDLALEALQMIPPDDPSIVDARWAIASHLAQHGSPETARAVLEDLTEPTLRALAVERLATWAAENGDPGLAIGWAEAATDPWTRARLLLGAATVADEDGR